MSTREEALENAGAFGGQAESGGGESFVNVGQAERWASAVGGGALALYGLTRGSLGGVALALIGGTLIYRGASGHCSVYQAAGINTAGTAGRNPNVSVESGRGTKVEKSVTIDRPASELYGFWRNFENLPKFMHHLESVSATTGGRTHWVAKGPAGTSVEWDAEVYNEKPNELIAWRSLEGSQVDNAGSVHFEPAPDGRGTVVRVVLKYDPPAGKLGAVVARLFGESPARQIEDDLQRFKQLMETGAAASNAGQTSGRAANA